MVRLGIDILLNERRDLIGGRRIGVLANAASMASDGAHAIDGLLSLKNVSITCLFGPEHGIKTDAQDMEHVDSSAEPSSGLPVHSLYGKTPESLTPTGEMLNDLDALVIDLQDIGSRYYTYIWTAALCADACSKHGTDVIICDRPNPIGGLSTEGPGITRGFESFVGLFSVPVRHGMTIGEIVHLVNVREGLRANLTIVEMEGWTRGMLWPDTGLPWRNPSPNMRSFEAALLYPGMCLVEGTNMSEGRGTDEPFVLVGAPYIDSKATCDKFNALGLEGIRAKPAAFKPTKQKWANKNCEGVRWIIEDALSFKPYLTGLALVWLINRLYKEKGFEWRVDPYEFVADKPAIDLLTGSPEFRERINDLSFDDLRELAACDKKLLKERKTALIYPA